MTRRLLNLLTALSLLLLWVAVVVLWVRSYWASDNLQYTRVQLAWNETEVRQIIVTTDKGNAAVTVHRQIWNGTSEKVIALFGYVRGVVHESYPAVNHPVLGTRYPLGFGFDHIDHSDTDQVEGVWTVTFPLWAGALLTAALPAVRLAHRARRIHRPGLCPSCAYDLRATPRRCPECGTPVGEAAA